MIDDLRDRWDLLVLDAGIIGPDAEQAITDVLAHHAEPHRRYHSIEHLVEIHDALDHLAAAGHDAAEHVSVRLAAWFHDAVYDPESTSNEADSAALAAAELERIGFGPELRDEVVALVEMTATHEPDPSDPRATALSDADLSILAAAPERYVRYRRQVRAEFAHLDDAAWREGRTRVLSRFLDREHVFWTAEGRLGWEDAARANLRAEREILNRDP